MNVATDLANEMRSEHRYGGNCGRAQASQGPNQPLINLGDATGARGRCRLSPVAAVAASDMKLHKGASACFSGSVFVSAACGIIA